jgi:hypothetical protein
MVRADAAGWTMVIVSPVPSAVPMWAEQTTVLTPVVPEPFVTSASTAYELLLLSLQRTAPPAPGSVAKVTITLLPTATLCPLRRV